MRMCKYIGMYFLSIMVVIVMLTGCGENNTVQKFYVSEESYETEEAMENATQPDQLAVGQAVYGSVNFIESPKGMEYTVKWYLDGNEIKTETKEMISDKRGVIVFNLEADQVAEGTLKFEVIYKDDVLCSKELVVK